MSKPITLHEESYEQEIANVLDLLESSFEEDERFTMKQLAELFKSLNAHYEIQGSQSAEENGFNMNNELPITISELETIHKRLAELDGVLGSPFEQRSGDEAA